MDLEDCKAACEEEESYDCASIDYNTNNRYCYLQAVDRTTHVLSVCSGFKYLERDCDGKCPPTLKSWHQALGRLNTNPRTQEA